MLGLMLMCVLMIPLVSPIKVAFSVTISSIMVSVGCYSLCVAIFPSAGVVISFSSGMMILFCYCAMMTNYESKNYKNNTILMALILTMPLMIMMSENMQMGNNMKNMLSINSSPLIVSVMGVIILGMICINKSMFSPSKTLITSY
uniref:NADH dehydrogenase subunit 6 n=1 Tax=Sancassania mycophaga TaxID=3127633 RepID=UPI00315C520E